MASFEKAIAKFTFTLFFGITVGLSSGSPIDRQSFQCRNLGSELTFEVVKGHRQLSTAHLFEGGTFKVNKDLNTIQLCIEACRQNPECHSLNYQRDIGCVLFKTNASPNFSSYDAVNLVMVPEDNAYYAQKICLSGADRLCTGRPGAFDGEQLSSPSERSKNVLTITKRLSTTTGEICMEHCVNEKNFPCRLATFSDKIKECILTNSQTVIDVDDQMSPSLFYYRANCNKDNLEKSLSSLEKVKDKDDRTDYAYNSYKSFTDKDDLNKNSYSYKNQRIAYLKRLSGNSSRTMFIYAGVVVQSIALMALFCYSCWKKNKMKREKATLQVNNDGEGKLQLPTYWEAVNTPSPDAEASHLNWEVIDNNKVFYSEKNDPPPAYAEIIESKFTTDSGDDSNNKANENDGDLPPCYTYENS